MHVTNCIVPVARDGQYVHEGLAVADNHHQGLIVVGTLQVEHFIEENVVRVEGAASEANGGVPLVMVCCQLYSMLATFMKVVSLFTALCVRRSSSLH